MLSHITGLSILLLVASESALGKSCDTPESEVFLNIVHDSKNITKSISSAKKFLDYFSYDPVLYKSYKEHIEDEFKIGYHFIKYRLSILPFLSSIERINSFGIISEDKVERLVSFNIDFKDLFLKDGNYRWVKHIVISFDVSNLKIRDINVLGEGNESTYIDRSYVKCSIPIQ
ncbi:hypothetical protein [Pseudoalteromonas luteoviolacea]|uniref:Uncharacterized protein n=1 Tax=Pseudoalteromonas luteoviolacea S4054 TaxID=1129367 RepID=A0A0F6AD32_9GAMM|nr:hypothetical protein [Pseudoalteromonas luteoviolacea]AOT10632.1 hypothetical protein S4054249_22490 [Pseudoalteromonas luteoviolacea]AOT15300.1 hypothetical protein S40542_21105 [Pseudoalteromonas luteoviolacea]AOT20451.1 hypothetical protein S4054_22405 [Pseudoalteromonas luteoviolacea]KKE83731.1 hypothetical protein N479_12960 [Pseudoalteromonas luteoviolacea S4054]KZN71935.1 hypothetical protein N481_17325 [Pseudoalteromonas luteoviolacea S4047-1]